MKNTITESSAKFLKKCIGYTNIREGEQFIIEDLIDHMTGAPVFECMESMSKTIGKQKDEIERLKKELKQNNELIHRMEQQAEPEIEKSCGTCGNEDRGLCHKAKVPACEGSGTFKYWQPKKS